MEPMSSHDPYSTLEIDHRSLDTHKQATIVHKNDTEKETIAIHSNHESTTLGPFAHAGNGNREQTKIWGLRRHVFWILGAALGVCIVVGAVVGGVLGSRSQGTRPESTTASTHNESHSHASSKLAAVYYRDNNLVSQHRLYYQTSDNVVHEYATNDTNPSWYHMSEVGTAVANSSIAATVTYTPWQFDLRVYFLTEGNFIQEHITRDPTGSTSDRWDGQETVSLSAENIPVNESGNIAVLWDRQISPPADHIYALYENTQGNLTLLSGGTGGWIPKEVPFQRPSANTPITMLQSWPLTKNYTYLTMFYQHDDTGDIPGIWGAEEVGWENVSVPCPASSSDPNTSLASFVFSPSEDGDQIMVVLMSNADGVTSFTIKGGVSAWNSDKPEAMASLDRNTPLTATEDGRAFGIENGVIKEFRFASDRSWHYVSDVFAL